MTKVVWVENDSLRPRAGHGLDFWADESKQRTTLLAVLRGFEWLHGEVDEVEIEIRPADADYPEAALAAVRLAIEEYMEKPILRPGWESPTVYVWPNA